MGHAVVTLQIGKMYKTPLGAVAFIIDTIGLVDHKRFIGRVFFQIPENYPLAHLFKNSRGGYTLIKTWWYADDRDLGEEIGDIDPIFLAFLKSQWPEDEELNKFCLE